MSWTSCGAAAGEDEDSERRFATSDADVMAWFVEQMKEVHGFDISEGAPQVTQIFDAALQPGQTPSAVHDP